MLQLRVPARWFTSMSRFKAGGFIGEGECKHSVGVQDKMHLIVLRCIYMIHKGVPNSFSL